MSCEQPAKRCAQAAFEKLAGPLQKCLWDRGWTSLRAVQTETLPLILDTQDDVLIAASTASGKTEAAFLPLLTRLWKRNGKGIILYIAPMKALINDQEERLSSYCERLTVPVFPWHGDIGQASRKRFLDDPYGLILITPESLESLLFRRGTDFRNIFLTLEAVVVDELHAFVGTERGRQLQSLLNRLEVLIGQRIQRIALSATLGNMRLACEFLRWDKSEAVRCVVDHSGSKSLQLVLKTINQTSSACENVGNAHSIIAIELLNSLNDGNYLIFPNTTGTVELYADTLRNLCEAKGVPSRFFAHHGRLSKDERQFAEMRLKHSISNVSAICTTTLEMGIDIGAVKGIVQIGAPSTVMSLSQRIGRAGRRAGSPAILRQYCVIEKPQSEDDGISGLCPDFIQSVAIIRLFLEKWYEPPIIGTLNYSTLVQQILSLMGERQGVTPAEAYSVLCLKGPFKIVQKDFIDLLRSLAEKKLVVQDASGLLLHGVLGEKRVNHYTFFAAFPESQEYRLGCAGKQLGTLPLGRGHSNNDVLVFAGRRWSIVDIDHNKRRAELAPAAIGKIPVTGGEGIAVHDRVREEMRAILRKGTTDNWLNDAARKSLEAATKCYRELNLDKSQIITRKASVYIFLWKGDRTQNALAILLQNQGMRAKNIGICVQIENASISNVLDALMQIATNPCPSNEKVLDRHVLSGQEKWDWVLPDRLFYESYAASKLEFAQAYACVKSLLGQH
jgi:ATP-dependent Lhr-like helicase